MHLPKSVSCSVEKVLSGRHIRHISRRITNKKRLASLRAGAKSAQRAECLPCQIWVLRGCSKAFSLFCDYLSANHCGSLLAATVSIFCTCSLSVIRKPKARIGRFSASLGRLSFTIIAVQNGKDCKSGTCSKLSRHIDGMGPTDVDVVGQ